MLDKPDIALLATSVEPTPLSAALSCGMPYEYKVPALSGVAPVIVMLALSASLALLFTTSSVKAPFVRLAAHTLKRG